MEKMKNVFQAIRAWDQKHTNLPSWFYMGIVIAAALIAGLQINQVAAATIY